MRFSDEEMTQQIAKMEQEYEKDVLRKKRQERQERMERIERRRARQAEKQTD